MKRPTLILIAVLVLGDIAAMWWFLGRPKDDARIPDEKRVAMIELSDRQQSGPEYFHAEPATQPDEQGILWIAPDKAAAQVDRVMHERKLTDAGRDKLMKLIDEIAEDHPSRTIGGSRVNVARLNVALDSLEK